MSNSALPPSDDSTLADDDTLPSGHPATATSPTSAGEVLSGEGTGPIAPGPRGSASNEPERDREPDADS